MPSPAPRAARLVLACAVTLAVGALLGGCGDSGDDRALSKREYIQQGNDLQRDATTVFRSLDGKLAATPAAAGSQIKAFDTLIEGYGDLRPPAEWRDEHSAMVEALTNMRQAMSIVSKASASNTPVITTQLKRFNEGQRDFEQAVRDVNASR